MSGLKQFQSVGTNTPPGMTDAASDKQPSVCWINAAKGIQKCFKKGVRMYATKDLWKALDASSNYCFYCKPKLTTTEKVSLTRRCQILFLEGCSGDGKKMPEMRSYTFIIIKSNQVQCSWYFYL